MCLCIQGISKKSPEDRNQQNTIFPLFSSVCFLLRSSIKIILLYNILRIVNFYIPIMIFIEGSGSAPSHPESGPDTGSVFRFFRIFSRQKPNYFAREKSGHSNEESRQSEPVFHPKNPQIRGPFQTRCCSIDLQYFVIPQTANSGPGFPVCGFRIPVPSGSPRTPTFFALSGYPFFEQLCRKLPSLLSAGSAPGSTTENLPAMPSRREYRPRSVPGSGTSILSRAIAALHSARSPECRPCSLRESGRRPCSG